MSQQESLARYRDRVDGWIRQRIGENRRSWHILVRSLPGVDPTTVLESLRRQRLVSQVLFDGDTPPASGVDGCHNTSFIYDSLPIPHPLDYCWWFDQQTIATLCARINALTSPVDHVALLGAPTLLPALSRGSSARALTLIDADLTTLQRCQSTVHTARTHLADLRRDPVPYIQAHAVLADPPWYENEMMAFLWAARRLCVVGGHVLISVPPEGTRPDVAQEWARIAASSQEMGLELVDFQRGALSYLSPLFEQNALLAANVPATDGNWRRGDLAVLRCIDECAAVRPRTVGDLKWDERSVTGVRIRLRVQRRVGWQDPTLRPIADTDVLPSISRRDHRRSAVDVWTSGNRVFSCAGVHIVREILDAAVAGDDVVSRVQEFIGSRLTDDREEKVSKTANKLLTIIQTEGAEVAAWKELHARMEIVTR